MIVVKDKNMVELGILENSYDVSIKRAVNEIWQSSFSMPKSDPKNSLCSHMNYIDITGPSGRYYGLYRIMPTETSKSNSGDIITYTCEHVISTLLDDVISGYFQLSGYSTTQTLQSILNLQETTNWVIGTVEFNYYYEYSFENENGLLAPILSIPKAFEDSYEFTYDTTIYPWVLNLKSVSNEVKSEIRWGKDMIDFSEISDPTDIVNYLIPKGTGEGINQLSIESVNSGLKYLKDDESISTWGKRSYIWIDSSIEDANTLKAKAYSLLEQWKNPTISFTVKAADLSILPKYSQERRLMNSITHIIVENEEYIARIIGEDIGDLSKEYDVTYQINNKISDIATTTANLERAISVSSAYSQGATNILNFSFLDNCDNSAPAIITFYIDDDVVNINTCELTYGTKKYRGYTYPGASITEPTSINTSGVTISSVPNTHTHSATMPPHQHPVTLGIVEYDVLPNSLVISVDGNIISGMGLTGERINLISYLAKTNGVISRGKHEIIIIPNEVARIDANIILRVFIQSRLGGIF